jgi:hypothetical protein
MKPLSRVRTRLLPLALVLVATSVLSGCGSDEPTARASASPSSTVSASESPSESAGPAESASPASAGAQVVKVEKYGISYELPKGWITLNAKKVFKSGGNSPFLAELADRMGTTREQLLQMFASSVESLSVSDRGAQHGFLENVNTVGQEQVLNDDVIKLQLATIGAKPGTLEHASSPAGDVTRVPYDLPSKAGFTIRGIALIVYTDNATVIITVSSSSATSGAKIADQIQGSLKKIAGSGPNL